MRTDDIFEAMTDIDDKFIEAARPLEPLHDGQPVTVAPMPRRARWKTIVPAAACIAAVLTTAAIGGKYVYTKTHSAASDRSESIAFWYPEMAKYAVSEKITNKTEKLTYAYTTSGAHYERWDNESYYAKDYEELAAKSDLIVAGQFMDRPHQAQDPEEIHHSGHDCVLVGNGEVIDETDITGPMEDACMFNYLQVGRVLKGDVKADDYLLINQETSINKGGSDYYIVFAYDRLTPMLKGDEWIYFLQKTEDGYYIPVNGAQGRYPMPNNNNVDFSEAEGKIDEFSTYPNAAPARDEIYAELVEILNTENTPPIEQIGVPGESFNTFTIEEFPDVEFKVSRLGVTADDVDVFSMGDGQLDNLILADLNGDGKRELCATITEDTRSRAVVRDLENGGYYSLAGKREYFLSVNDNVLNVNEHMWESMDLRTTTREQLTLDMMLRTIPSKNIALIALDGEDTFCLEEYPDIPFRASEEGVTVDETQFGYLRHVIFGGVELEKLFLADITGDGKRELIALGSCNGEPETLAYDIETGETRIISGAAGYTVYGNDGMLVTLNGELLTFDMMPKTDVMDYSKVSLEHHGSFTLPDFDGFRFLVNTTYKSLDIDYDFSGGGLGMGTSPVEAYFCDADGDGDRELIMNEVLDSEGNIGVVVYDVFDGDELGRATYKEDGCRLVEENGKLLIKTSSGVSAIKYSEDDLESITRKTVFHILTSKDSVVIMKSGSHELAEGYRVETKSGRLIISKDGETLFESPDNIDNAYAMEKDDYTVFVYINKNDGYFYAFVLSDQTRKLVCLDEENIIGAAPIGDDDDGIQFADSRSFTINNIIRVAV